MASTGPSTVLAVLKYISTQVLKYLNHFQFGSGQVNVLQNLWRNDAITHVWYICEKDKLLKRANSQSLNVSEVANVYGDYMDK